ncbi:MAG: S1C family serine protease [Nitrososphaeraceae archaeon]
MPSNYKGVIVASTQPDSPAEKAGLKGLSQDDSGTSSQTGDIITAVDGHPVRQIDDIISYIDSYKNVGDDIKLTVNRDGQIMDIPATLEARPQTNPSSSSSEDQTQPPGLGPIPELPQIPGFPKLPQLPPFLP